ncbi:MAG: FtsX-like permease family protein [Planctomycetaceae bacterium]|jgi:putative ABC transport system permease protein|nr:FtsX-like permease family protein [Phycisphaerales bacterium]MCE2654641.1 FtsX-like permease family protein [Planctomycetaceae bacterium]
MTDLTLVRKSLLARLPSTVVTVLTVGVAVALLLLLLSMREAGRQSFQRGTGDMHILVSADASPLASVLNSVFYAAAPARALRMDIYEKIAEDPRLEYAIPVQQGDNFRGFPTMATVPAFFEKFRPEAGANGRGFRLRAGAFMKDTFDVVLGAGVAEATGAKVGDKLVITHGAGRGTPKVEGMSPEEADMHVHDEFPYVIAGILEPTGSAHDRAVFISLDSTWIIHADERRHADARAAGRPAESVPEPTKENLRPEEKLITGVYIRVKTREGSEGSPAIGAVFDQLRRDVRLTVARPSREIDRLLEIIGNIDRILIAIAAVVLVSSAISIALALYNSMEQRRRQIAVLRVLGASKRRVFGLVMTESAILGLLGAGVGAAAAALGTGVVVAELQRRTGLVVDPTLEVRAFVAVAMGAVVLACLAGVLPAVMAYRTTVQRGLRAVG